MRNFVMMMAVFALTACQTEDKSSSPAKAPVGAYMIVNGKNYEVKDIAPYAASLPPIYKKYGGHYVTLTQNYDVMEGSSDAQSIIVTAWPNVEAAKSFWNSPEYAEAIKLREGIGEFDVVIVPAILPK